MNDIDVTYGEVGRTARDWDEQHVRLAGAADQVGGAPLGGFTPRVAELASLFCSCWAGHLGEAGQEAEVRADGLRDALREYVDSDASSFVGTLPLVGLLRELR